MIKPTIGTYTIYTKSDCIFCDKVKELLKNEKIVIVSCDEMLKNDEKKKHFLEILKVFLESQHNRETFFYNNNGLI